MSPEEIIRFVVDRAEKFPPVEVSIGDRVTVVINPDDPELRYEVSGVVAERGGGWASVLDEYGHPHPFTAADKITYQS